MADRRHRLERFQFSLSSILIVTTLFAAFLSFASVVGLPNAMRPVWGSIFGSLIIWGLFLIPKDTRKWNHFFPITCFALSATILAGFLCIYLNELSPEKIDISAHWKFQSMETRAFEYWTGWGRLIGPIAGIIHNWLRYSFEKAKLEAAPQKEP